MARSSMAGLITRLRTMVGDSEDPTFSDDELQGFLDERRGEAAYAVLQGDYNPAGAPLVFRAAAPATAWESDAVLTSAGIELTPDDSDPLLGMWSFATAPAADVYVTGRWYDLYGSASAVAIAWAARVAREFDFGTDQQTFSRSQKREGLMAVAREFARRAIPPSTRSAFR